VILNQYPFLPLHSLLVPERKKHLPQFMTEEMHRWSWEAAESMEHLPATIGYNSMKAHASVNNFHLQLSLDTIGLPITFAQWEHNGGGLAYPARHYLFDSFDTSWKWLDQQNLRDSPYNLVYTPGRVHCFGQLDQGTYPMPSWTSGFAFCEMGGSFITFNRQDYLRITEEDYTRALAEMPGYREYQF